MAENNTIPNPSASNLRQRAEAKFRAGKVPTPAQMTPEETRQALHELQVHQIELEMQNDELLRTQAELEASRARYFDLYDLAPVGYVTLNKNGLILEANLTAATLLDVERSKLVKQPLTRFIFSEDQDLYYRLSRQLFGTGTRQAGELRLRRANAGFCWVQLEMTFAQETDGAPVCRTVWSDITDRKEAEQLLHERVEAHAYEQAMLLEISSTLAATLELKPALILNQLRGIIEYTQGGLFTLEGHTLVVQAICGTPLLEQSSHFRIDIQGSEILNTLFNVSRPICIADVWSDDPQALFLRSLLEDGGAILLAGMKSWMWVPMLVKNRIIGGLAVAHVKPNFFTLDHANLALIVAHKAAITMVNAELNQQAKELAVMQERQNLARNLHDAVNQSLFSAGLIAEVLPRLWERDQAEARQSIADLVRLMRGAQAEMRALLAELRPATLTDSDLNDLLHLLGNAFSGRTNVPVEIARTEGLILPAEVQVIFYRVCQEALNNIAKHAQPTLVQISLEHKGTLIVMIIRDNGQGFDTDQIFTGHYGISMMRERAEAVGAPLAITSQIGHGTTVSLSWTPPPAEEA